MKVRNVKVPEGINVSRHRPVADLFVLTAGAVGLFLALGLVAFLIGTYAGRYMPMSWENALAAPVFEGEEMEEAARDAEEIAAAARDDEEIAAAARADEEIAAGARDRELEAALPALADRLAVNMNLP